MAWSLNVSIVEFSPTILGLQDNKSCMNSMNKVYSTQHKCDQSESLTSIRVIKSRSTPLLALCHHNRNSCAIALFICGNNGKFDSANSKWILICRLPERHAAVTHFYSLTLDLMHCCQASIPPTSGFPRCYFTFQNFFSALLDETYSDETATVSED